MKIKKLKNKIYNDYKCKIYTMDSHEVVTTTLVHPMKVSEHEPISDCTIGTKTESKMVRFCTDVTVFHYRYKKLSVYRRLRKMIIK